MFKSLIVIVSASLLIHSQQLPTLEITLAQDSIDVLEADPFSNDDVHGDFTADDTLIFENVEIHYRGAYNLWSLIEDSTVFQRNWKVKFPKENKYRNRREWNFNFEQHLRQKLAYDLMGLANVAAASARHVLLHVNGERHGLYLEYEDPDSKDWLLDTFGDKSGDLYKAGYDMPDEPSYFGLLTDLGDSSSNYFMHYRKQTNKDSTNADDYSLLIKFIKMINYSPQESFQDSIEKYFDVQSFLRYLVVSNFILNWDSYPTRPKNYWLYHIPSVNRWAYIPWDLDLTFRRKKFKNTLIDTDCSIFYQLLEFEPINMQPNEGTERPLVHRMMQCEAFYNGYIKEYRKAITSYLEVNSVLNRVDSLSALIEQNTDGDELMTFRKSVAPLKTFITDRYQHVKAQLEALPEVAVYHSRFPVEMTPSTNPVSVYSTFTSAIIHMSLAQAHSVTIAVTDISGRLLATVYNRVTPAGRHRVMWPAGNRVSGVYFVVVKFGNEKVVHKVVVD